MRGVQETLVVILLATVALAGCLGDDQVKAAKGDEAPPVAEEAVVTGDTGSVKGQIFTIDLEPVVKETAGLLSAGTNEAVLTTTTDTQGRFTFNGVEPGSYRIHIAAACCVSVLQDVVVVAGQVAEVNFQVERLSNVAPFVEENEWQGFIACGAGTPVITAAVCSIANDPNDDFLHSFNMTKGLKSLVIGMTWDAVGGASGEKLMLLVEKLTGKGYTYASPNGVSPLLAHITDETIQDGHAKFDAITVEEGLDARYRVFVPFEVGVVYQQPFMVYWHEYYNMLAPEDVSVIPDG